jgi:hypothetical protein
LTSTLRLLFALLLLSDPFEEIVHEWSELWPAWYSLPAWTLTFLVLFLLEVTAALILLAG